MGLDAPSYGLDDRPRSTGCQGGKALFMLFDHKFRLNPLGRLHLARFNHTFQPPTSFGAADVTVRESTMSSRPSPSRSASRSH